jgi:hypothetical protein
MRKKIIIGCVLVVTLLLLMPSIPAIQKKTIGVETYSDFIEQLPLDTIKGGLPLDWEPGLIIEVFLILLEVFIDFIISDGWFPGITFIFTYLFILFVILVLRSNNPE